jgi:hypothetical protein
MTKQLLKGLTMFTLIVVLSLFTAVASANGQLSRRQVADIPFDFVVGDKEMPAGTYSLEGLTGGEVVRIRATKNETSAFRLTSLIVHTKAAEKSQLVFHRYGNSYFLAETWIAGDTNGRRLNKSSLERAMEQELAANPSRSKQNYERVEIALVRQ